MAVCTYFVEGVDLISHYNIYNPNKLLKRLGMFAGFSPTSANVGA